MGVVWVFELHPKGMHLLGIPSNGRREDGCSTLLPVSSPCFSGSSSLTHASAVASHPVPSSGRRPATFLSPTHASAGVRARPHFCRRQISHCRLPELRPSPASLFQRWIPMPGRSSGKTSSGSLKGSRKGLEERSRPIVVERPWPGNTVVEAGSRISFSMIERISSS